MKLMRLFCGLLLAFALPASAQQRIAQNQTTVNVVIGPVVSSTDGRTALTGLLTAGSLTATGGNAGGTTITSATTTAPFVGQWIVGATGTAGNIGFGRWVTAVSGSSGAYTLTVSPALPAQVVNTDTFTLSSIVFSLSKNGGAFVVPAGAPTETGSGYYALAGNATDASTLGRLIAHWDATLGNGNTNEITYVVEQPNPYSASTGGYLTVGTGTGQINPSGGKVSLSPTQSFTNSFAYVNAKLGQINDTVGNGGTAATTLAFDNANISPPNANAWKGWRVTFAAGTANAGQVNWIKSSTVAGADGTAGARLTYLYAWPVIPSAGDQFYMEPDLAPQQIDYLASLDSSGHIDTTTLSPSLKLLQMPRGYLMVTGQGAGNYYEDALYNGVPTYSNGAGLSFWNNGSAWILSSVIGTPGSHYWTSTTNAVNGTYTETGGSAGLPTVSYKGNSILASFQPDQTILTSSQVAAAVWNAGITSYTTVGSFGNQFNNIDGYTLNQALSVILAFAAGNTTIPATGQADFLRPGGTQPRIHSTIDATTKTRTVVIENLPVN